MSYLDKFLDVVQSQVGYKESGKNQTKYSKYFDTEAWQFFNTKKQGAEWCSIFIHWCMCQILDPKKVRSLLGEPSDPSKNCGAGVKYLWEYVKAKKLTVKSPKEGDIIFFNSFGHVGVVENVDSKVYTIEGNKSNQVKRCTYSKGSTKICGYARIKWPAEAKEDPKETVELKPDIPPIPATSFNKKYNSQFTVKESAPLLNLRPTICYTMIPKGASVRCYGFFTGDFLYVKFKDYEGYINRRYLE